MKLSMKNSVVVRHRVSHARPGQALVPVLLVMLILTILSIAFAVSAQREIKSGTNFVSQTQRYYAARGAAMYAASSLANSSSNGATYGIVQKTGDTDANGWRQIGEAWVKIEVVDSAASLSLNGADLATLQRFPVLKDSPELVAAILDWRTPGDQPSENGAKNEYYSALNPAYNCKSAPYETVEELLLVKGITPTILYGNASGSAISQSDLQSAQSASANSAGGSLSSISSSSRSGTRQAPQPGQAGQGNNGGQGGQNGQGSGQNGGQNGQNGQANPTGQDAQTQDDAAQFQDIFTNSHIPLSELLTPTSRERNISADGQPRVNINTATQEELTQKLSLPANVVRNLINYRNGGDGGVGGGRPRNRPNGGQNGQGGGQNGQGGNGGQGNNGGQGGGQNGNGRPRQNGGRPRLNRPRIFSRSANDLTAESNTRQAAPAPGNSRPNGGNGGQNGGGKPRPNGGQGNNGGQGGNGGGQNGGQNGQGGTGGAKKTFRTIGDLLEVNGITRSVMQKIADKVTIDDATVRENVVNINTAPSEVLATVPGMTRTMLDAIIGYRGGGQAFQTLGDLFTLQTIQRADFEKAIGSLTTKSSLYTVRVKVKMPNSSGIYATTALVELTENGPRIRQWREVSRSPGWSQWIPSPVLPQPGQSSTPEAGDDSATPSPQGQNGANR